MDNRIWFGKVSSSLYQIIAIELQVHFTSGPKIHAVNYVRRALIEDNNVSIAYLKVDRRFYEGDYISSLLKEIEIPHTILPKGQKIALETTKINPLFYSLLQVVEKENDINIFNLKAEMLSQESLIKWLYEQSYIIRYDHYEYKIDTDDSESCKAIGKTLRDHVDD